MVCPWIVVGDDLEIWRAGAIILNKQSQTADKGCYCSLGVWQGANSSSL